VLSRLGAVPVAISIQELFESVDRGVITGFTGIPLSAVKAAKLDETAKYYIDFGYGNYLTEFVCMNTKKWNSLPADIRKIIEEVNAEGINLYVDLYAKEEAKYVTPLKEGGCTFTILPEEEVAKWKKLVAPAIYDKWVEKNSKYGNARAFYDAYIKEVRNFEPMSTYVSPFPGVEKPKSAAKPAAKPEKGKK
jgi:TRAP-type C4-dicarboxylate transport system substrate-binding protein